MRFLIFNLLITIFKLQSAYCFPELLNLDAASVRISEIQASTRPSQQLWKKLDDFFKDPDFSNRSVACHLEDKFPENSQLLPWMDRQQLLSLACHLKRLHYLTDGLKESFENIFFLLELSIDELNPEEINRLWGCVSGCGYSLPKSFLEKLDRHTDMKRADFNNSLVLSTLKHLSVLPEGRAFNRFVQLFSAIDDLPNSNNDMHNYIFLKTYLAKAKSISVESSRLVRSELKRYRRNAIYPVTISAVQRDVTRFLQRFDADFASEVFCEDLDTHFDIALVQAKIVVDVDGLHHYKEDISSSTYFRRPQDLMRDAVLLKCGWKVYRIRPDEWDKFKVDFSSKMTEQNTLDTFYRLYTVNF